MLGLVVQVTRSLCMGECHSPCELLPTQIRISHTFAEVISCITVQVTGDVSWYEFLGYLWGSYRCVSEHLNIPCETAATCEIITNLHWNLFAKPLFKETEDPSWHSFYGQVILNLRLYVLCFLLWPWSHKSEVENSSSSAFPVIPILCPMRKLETSQWIRPECVKSFTPSETSSQNIK